MNFIDYIKNLPENDYWEKLPLVHTTLLVNFKSILEAKKLSPTECRVLNGKYLYFFYGKPNYRSSKGDKQSTQMGWFPICILFKSDIISKTKIANAFPFDTGAFSKGLYASIINDTLKLTDYRLPNNLKDIGKFLNFMFSSAIDYFNGDTKQIELDAFPLELNDCYNLYNVRGDQPFDDRAKTIEISISKPIRIIKNLIELIICPESLRKTMDKEFGNDFNVKYYHTKKLCKAQDFYNVIDQYAYDYLNEKYFGKIL